MMYRATVKVGCHNNAYKTQESAQTRGGRSGGAVKQTLVSLSKCSLYIRKSINDVGFTLKLH